MENLGERNILRIPLAALQFAPDIRSRITQDEAAFRQHCLRLYSDYEWEVQARLLTQLEWAIQHPEYNFWEILIDVKTANEDILFYFAFLVSVIKQIANARLAASYESGVQPD
jgi:hypothetical protein